MWIALVALGVAAFEISSFRFAVDSREPGDWHRVEFGRTLP